VLPQFACAKIQLENSKTETPAKLIVFSHGEVNRSEKEVYHERNLLEYKAGIFSYKSSLE
jgi:hypothetical protein